MITIHETIADESIAEARFACDLARCKGACCTLPGYRGAPLEDDELSEIERAFPAAEKYLSQHHLQVIEAHGLFEGGPGDFATTCVDHNECVFVFYEEDIARCALEKAFINGETSWRKPISCHLFPIRVSPGRFGTLRYERISECDSARSRGAREDVPLYKFLKDPLTRKYGEEWYEVFHAECERRDAPINENYDR